MKAYDACPKCRTVDRSTEWIKGETKRPYYFCVCQECDNIYHQTFYGQETNDIDIMIPIKSTEIKPKLIDPVPYIPGPNLLQPLKRGKDTTSQARL